MQDKPQDKDKQRDQHGSDHPDEEDPMDAIGSVIANEVTKLSAHALLDKLGEDGMLIYLAIHGEEYNEWLRDYYIPVVTNSLHRGKMSRRIVMHIVGDMPTWLPMKPKARDKVLAEWSALVGGEKNG